MKKLTTISLFIFWVITAAILTAGLVFYQNNKSMPALSNFPDLAVVSFSADLSGSGSAPGAATLSLAVIAQHSSLQDCWLLIDNKVYNVSSYLSSHPGGVEIIIPYCGKEATNAFATKDGKGSHSDYAHSLLANYYVGTLNQAINQSASDGNQKAGTSNNGAAVSQPVDKTVNPVVPAPVAPVAPANVNLSASEIAKHNTTADCWLIINNKIYSVTSYLSAHPGGVGAISPYCGKEATNAFATKGGQGSHSTNAHNILANYYIGDLNQTVSQPQIQESVNNTNLVQPPAGGGEREDEEEDD